MKHNNAHEALTKQSERIPLTNPPLYKVITDNDGSFGVTQEAVLGIVKDSLRTLDQTYGININIEYDYNAMYPPQEDELY